MTCFLRFCDFLSLEDNFTWQTFYEGGEKGRAERAYILHGLNREIISRLQTLNNEGHGIFVCVNEGDGEGRKASNIKKVRALYVDLDREIEGGVEEILAYSKSKGVENIGLIVESSKNKYHIYWKVEDVEIDEFRGLQKKLINIYSELGADRAIHNLDRVMRVPGFRWQKEGGDFTSRIVYETEEAGIDWLREREEKEVEKESEKFELGINIQTGQRNVGLYNLVWRICFLEHGMELELAKIVAFGINKQFIKPSLDDEEVIRTVESAYRGWKETGKSRTKITPRDLQGVEGCDRIDTGEVEAYFKKYDYDKPCYGGLISELSLVDRIITIYKDVLTSIQGAGLLLYNDGIWEGMNEDKPVKGLIRNLIVDICSHVCKEPKVVNTLCMSKTGVDKTKINNINTKLFSSKNIDCLYKLLVESSELYTYGSELNGSGNPNLLNLNNCVVNLHTLEVMPHSPTFKFITKAGVKLSDKYVKGNKLDLDRFVDDWEDKDNYWKKFIGEFTVNRPELEEYMKRMFGYILSGYTTEQCMFFLFGNGNNGKSRLTWAWEKVLGDYCITTPIEAFTSKSIGGSNELVSLSALSKLVGKRLVLTSEITDSSYWKESLIKDITGDDTIIAKKYHRDIFEFKPQCKIIPRGNNKPKIQGADAGIKRRFKLIPCNMVVTNKDIHINEKLLNELETILLWGIAGFRDYINVGHLNDPVIINNEIDDYLATQNPITDFLEIATMPGEGLQIHELYQAYNGWRINHPEAPDYPNENKFYNELVRHNLSSNRVRINGEKVRVYNLSLTIQGQAFLKEGSKPIRFFG